jgi:secernin
VCDTILAQFDSTAEGVLLFGKNSDRQRNEAQVVDLMPASSHQPGSPLRCTYIEIPQVPRTHGVLLCRPFWMWGAEMGANEYGVVVGNEGLHARTSAPEAPALTGMDLVRLALERGQNAAESVKIITALLAQYGQGGNCGHLTPSYYHNGFLIADYQEAFVLETVGRDWVLERIDGLRALSNEYSVGSDVIRTSAGMPDLLRAAGWRGEGTPDHAALLAHPETVHVSSAHGRRARATSLLGSAKGSLRLADILKILRDHDPTGRRGFDWNPQETAPYSLCVHAGALDRFSQTTGSMASEISASCAVHWVTGTAAPCLSIFKPVQINVPLPPRAIGLSDRFDPATLWWRHERFHRAVLLDDFPKFLDDIRDERDTLETTFHARVTAVLQGGSLGERSRVISNCWRDAIETEDRWYTRLERKSQANNSPYHAAWAEMNRIAGIPEL